MDSVRIKNFQKTVWSYYKKNKRDLPWRRDIDDPYKVLVSEVMLQQTQAGRVMEPYRLFLKLFPNFKVLARAKTSAVLKVWSGLGYYRRALNIKRAAEIVVAEYGGKLPASLEELIKLPGVGRNTAGAVLAYAFNKPVGYIETNIRRIYIYHFFHDKDKVSDSDLLPFVESLVPKDRAREWYQALMDYGTHLAATVENPNRRSKHYARQSKFEGSNRQLRGQILRLLLEHTSLTLLQLTKLVRKPERLVAETAAELSRENFIVYRNKKYTIL